MELLSTADHEPRHFSTALFQISKRHLCQGMIIAAFNVNSHITKLQVNRVNFPLMGIIGLIGFTHAEPQHEAEENCVRLCDDIAIQLNKETRRYKGLH